MPDKVVLTGLEVQARVGLSELERAQPQPLSLDLELETDLSRSPVPDDHPPVVDAAKACDLVVKLLEEKPRRLLESIASEAADLLLYAFPMLDAVRVRVIKKSTIPKLTHQAAEVYRRR